LNIKETLLAKISWRQNRSGSPTDPVSDRLDITELLRPLRISIFFERSVLYTLVSYVCMMHAVRKIPFQPRVKENSNTLTSELETLKSLSSERKACILTVSCTTKPMFEENLTLNATLEFVAKETGCMITYQPKFFRQLAVGSWESR
jgi:hypothetical protein